MIELQTIPAVILHLLRPFVLIATICIDCTYARNTQFLAFKIDMFRVFLPFGNCRSLANLMSVNKVNTAK